MAKFKKLLNSNYSFAFFLLLGVASWLLDIGYIFAIVLATYILCVFVLCDNPIYALLSPLTIAFFLNDFKDVSYYVFYGIAIGLFVIGSVYYIVKMLCFSKIKVAKGKMFYGFVALTFAMILGGIIGHFNILSSLVLLGFMIYSYYFYFVCINFISNLKEKLVSFFITVGLVLYLQLILCYIRAGNFFETISNKGIFEIGVQNVNVCAIYLLLAMLSTFYLAVFNRDRDWLYMLFAFAFLIAVLLTCSRICMLLGVLSFIACSIYVFVKSSNKKIFGIAFAFFLALVLIPFAFMADKIVEIIYSYISNGISFNGRETLWPWCFDRFINNPIFGIGFVTTNDPVPTVTTQNIVMAHNTFLQYLTSCGLIGSALAIVYYVQKYRVLIGNRGNRDAFAIQCAVVIALIGLVDQAPTTDIFVFIIINMLVAVSEKRMSPTVNTSKLKIN